MTLTKADLVQKIYQNHNMTKADASKAVETFLAITKEALVHGEDVLLSGFGKFNVKEKKERRGRNPQTGEELLLSGRKVVTFKASGLLRDRINNSK
jgi:integration host factor subunit alpha